MMMLALCLFLQAAAPPAPGQRELKMQFAIDKDFIRKADRNGDGALDFGEFADALDKQIDIALAMEPEAAKKMTLENRAKMRDQMMGSMFRSMDKNSDGRFTLDELPAGKDASRPATAAAATI